MTVTRGVKRAEALMELLGHANFEADGKRWISKHPEAREHAGPLWTGPLFSKGILGAMSQHLSEHTQGIEKDLALWEKEWGAAPLFYDTNIMARKFKASPPKLATLLEGLRGMGFSAQPTYFTPTGFKTDAQPGDMRALFTRKPS
jgi:tRNA (guanine26-N2/guanine27-N2)-dimethyltransferase